MNNPSLQKQIYFQGQEIFSLIENKNKSIFSKDFWYGHIMDWSIKRENFRVQMFRFIDVLPYLKSNKAVAQHLKEYFAGKDNTLPHVFNMGLGLGSLAPSIMSAAIRKNIMEMAKIFITGESPETALPVLTKGRENSLCFTVDLLGEATISEKEAADYQQRYIDLINKLSDHSKEWEEDAFLDRNENGIIPKINISIKISSLYSQINESAWDESKEKIKERLRPIFLLAQEKFAFINLDMESYIHKDMTIEIFKELTLEPEFKDYPHWGLVIQSYLKDSFQDITNLIEFSKERSVEFTIRLVKGAYWDYETIVADQKNWSIPVYTVKSHCDANYEKCAELLLDSYPHVRTAIASHNVRSISHAMVIAKNKGLDQRAVEFQMIYGMADEIKMALVKKSYRVRQYATVGKLIPGMAYLVRRLLENTANTSFLRSKFVENASSEKLLEDPLEVVTPEKAEDKTKYFQNEAPLDFTVKEVRDKISQAIKSCKNKKYKYLPVIDNKKIPTQEFMESINPSHPDEALGSFGLSEIKDAKQAIESSKKTFSTWKNKTASERAGYLDALADLILENRYELAALEILEVGKTWIEADGDITEAVDFCRYYSKNLREISKPFQVGQVKGEVSFYHYQPRGVSLVIAPWNFPLAILTGMVGASFVTGNTVIMKPAEQSSLIAGRLMEMLQKINLPPGVVQFIPGRGEVVGEYLTGHKDISIINFTGSRDVGLRILEKAGKPQINQLHLKKCIIEMGGKNAIIVDSDADLDEAILGIVHSAFHFQGQKCSACSRVIVLEENYSLFLERLIEATKSLSVGFSENPETKVGPVIDKAAQKIILEKIESAKSYAHLAFQKETPSEGFFVPPTIFTEVTKDMEIAQVELFGPVLVVLKAKDMDEALEIANSTEYGLTGGVYSRSPIHIEKVKSQFQVGNLYINRSITGAMVDRHPFGGFKMSGIGSKTGGPDYLKQFMEPYCITENTMRRGFAPDH